jgi:hypothetical protein
VFLPLPAMFALTIVLVLLIAFVATDTAGER